MMKLKNLKLNIYNFFDSNLQKGVALKSKIRYHDYLKANNAILLTNSKENSLCLNFYVNLEDFKNEQNNPPQKRDEQFR
jgi:hypothetical protein